MFKPSKAGSKSSLEKRTFGVTSGKGKAVTQPPVTFPLPAGVSIAGILAMPELQACSVAITPACVAGKFKDLLKISQF